MSRHTLHPCRGKSVVTPRPCFSLSYRQLLINSRPQREVRDDSEHAPWIRPARRFALVMRSPPSASRQTEEAQRRWRNHSAAGRRHRLRTVGRRHDLRAGGGPQGRSRRRGSKKKGPMTFTPEAVEADRPRRSAVEGARARAQALRRRGLLDRRRSSSTRSSKASPATTRPTSSAPSSSWARRSST